MKGEWRLIQKFEETAFRLAMVLVILRWILLIYYAIIQPQPAIGDEVHFLNYLNILKEYGIAYSFSNSIAINYTILALPLNLVFNELVSLRLVNLILLSLFISYLCKKDFAYSKYVILLVLLYSGKVGIFNVGINDALFAISFAIVLIEYISIFRIGKLEFPNLLFISLVFSLTTRPLIIIYLPLFLVVIWGLYKINLFKEVKHVTLAFSGFVLLMHIPSLIHNNTPCWDNKSTESEMTWAQRQYLAQIQASSGLRQEGTHPSWDELRLYLDHNGANSLPKTFVESIYFDWEITIKEFFNDLYYSFKGLLLQTGAISLLFLIGIFKKSVWKDKPLLFSFLPLLYALLVFSFIIISNVEWRWYAPVVLLFITSVGAIVSFERPYSKILIKVSLSLSTMALSAIGVYNLLINN